MRDYLNIIMRRKWWMLLAFVLVMATGILWTVTRTKLYSATVDIVASQKDESSYSMTSGIQILDDLKGLTMAHSVETQVSILQSPTLQMDAFQQLSPEDQQALKGKGQPPSRIKLAGLYTINNKKDTDLISVTATATTQHLAAVLANNLVQAYKDRDLQENREATSMATQYINDELGRVGKDLDAARAKLAALKKKTHLYIVDSATLSLPGGATSTVGTATGSSTLQQRVNAAGSLEADLREARRSLQEAQRTQRDLRITLGSTEKNIIAETTEAVSPLQTQIEAQIETLEQSRADLLQQYRPTAPEVKALDAQIQAAKQRLSTHLTHITAERKQAVNPLQQTLQKDYINARVQTNTMHTRIAVLQRQLDTLHQQLAQLPDQELQAAELMSSVAQLQNTYALLSEISGVAHQ